MKKLLIFFAGIIVTFAMLVSTSISANAVSPDKNFDVIIGDGGGSNSSIDIASSIPVSSIKSFEGLTHSRFGKISKVADTTSYDKENRMIYKSNWTTQEPIYQSFDIARFDTYTFEKYVDLPIKTLHSRKISVGESVSFTIQTTQIEEESKSETSTKATQFYWDYCGSLGFNMGRSLAIDLINLTSSITNSNTIKVGGNFTSTISNTRTSYTKYSIVYEETFTFDNTTCSHDTYFDMNFRQKFKIYFTTRYDYNYTNKEWGSGFLGRDQNWSYTFKDYTPVGTYIYLLPIENPYFEVSKYYDNNLGLKEILKSTTNSSIVYF